MARACALERGEGRPIVAAMDTLNTSIAPAAFTAGTARLPRLPRMGRRVAAWLRRLAASPDDRFLAGACDLADLEHRLRRLERHGLPGAATLWP